MTSACDVTVVTRVGDARTRATLTNREQLRVLRTENGTRESHARESRFFLLY